MVILIDNGHGAEVKGKQSPVLDSTIKIGSEFTENGRFREWKYNRVIAKKVVSVLKNKGYDARLVVTEDKDVSLGERVRRINALCKNYGAGNVLIISVHANAAGDSSAWLNGKGWECYTTKGVTKSDILSECLYKRAEINFRGRKIRRDTSDGDSDKEMNFYIIQKALCPAVLTENFFYDNKDDLAYMTSAEGVDSVVRTHVEGIIDYIGKVKKK